MFQPWRSLALTGLKLAGAPSYARLELGLRDPGKAQEALLRRLLSNLAFSEYGRSLGDVSVDNFQKRVPISTYADLRPWLDRQRHEGGPVFNADPVLFYEKTSGSSAAAKFIPYTTALRQSFTRMFLAWAHDVLAHGPPLRTGRTYISISPMLSDAEGTQLDTEYLSPALSRLVGPFLVGGGRLAAAPDPESFRRMTSLHLLAAEDLEVISIWSPSFLLVLLNHMTEHWSVLMDDLRRGAMGIQVRPERLEHLSRQPDLQHVWPHLTFISCWASADASRGARQLSQLFPQALVQGKGLLATEGPITIPWFTAHQAHVPLLHDVYLEFIDDKQGIHGLHELQTGQTYALIMSQRGGLLRYRLGDLVRVDTCYLSTPCLTFMGREGVVSDMVGEKLDAHLVREALNALPLPDDAYWFLVADPDGNPARYILVTDAPGMDVTATALWAEHALCAIHHYQHARKLGQLQQVTARALPRARERLLDIFAARGMKLGNIKEQNLVKLNAGELKLLFAPG